jgi:dolichol-phosphate mannosyltransferase
MPSTELLARREPHASDSAAAPPSIALFFPVYNDDHAVEALAEKSVRVLSEVASGYEILIVDDGSTDGTGGIADALAARLPNVRVVRHERNRGYGHAVRTGFAEVRRLDWIVFTDGDNQYDIAELRRFLPLLDRYDVLAGYRVRKTYGVARKILSAGLNFLVRVAFGVRVRDVTCGFKMVRSRVMDDPEMQLTSTGPFGGGEVVVRAALRGYHVGEVGISMYPRDYGRSSIVSFRNVVATLRDLRRARRDVFRNRMRAE